MFTAHVKIAVRPNNIPQLSWECRFTVWDPLILDLEVQQVDQEVAPICYCNLHIKVRMYIWVYRSRILTVQFKKGRSLLLLLLQNIWRSEALADLLQFLQWSTGDPHLSTAYPQSSLVKLKVLMQHITQPISLPPPLLCVHWQHAVSHNRSLSTMNNSLPQNDQHDFFSLGVLIIRTILSMQNVKVIISFTSVQ